MPLCDSLYAVGCLVCDKVFSIALNMLCWAAQGSFGRVFLGKWRETTVAIKLLNEPGMLHPEPWDAPNAPASLASAHRCVLSPGWYIRTLLSGGCCGRTAPPLPHI